MMGNIRYDNQGDALSRDVPAESLALIDEGGNGTERRYSYADLIRLMGQEVFPAIRDIAKSLDLKSPFEANAPVHLKYSTDLKPAKAVLGL